MQSVARLFPPALPRGATVSVVAPSFAPKAPALSTGLALLETWGLRLRLAPNLSAQEGYFAGPDALRAASLREALVDPDTHAVFCARGGYGAMRLLSHLPFSGLLSRPPLLVGYSDITALSLALYAQCGLVSVHGPMVGTLAQNPASTEELRALLFGKTPALVTLEDPLCLSPGMAEGPLLGGNLSLIAALAGTPYLPSLEGAILFLEDIDEKPYRIDRMLTQLELSGALDGLAGLLLGDFTGCVDPTYPEPNWISVIAERFQPKKIPILAGFPAGHGPQNNPLLMGALTRIDASRGLVIQLEGLAPAA